MINNTPYVQNVPDPNRGASGFGVKKLWRRFVILIILVAVTAGGYFFYQKGQRGHDQINFIKSANESYAGDVRYVSFGADYVFAIARSYTIDDSSIAGVQLLIPQGIDGTKLDNYDKLFDAAVVAVQSISQVEPNDSRGLKNYVNKTLVPDLKKNLSPDVTVKFAYTGKHQAATITVNKDGRQVRQVYAYGGSHPFMVVANGRSDAFIEVVATLIGVSDSTVKDETALIKPVILSSVTLLQEGKLQQLYDSASSDFRSRTSLKELTVAVNNSKSFINRHIAVPGGSLLGDQFAGQLTFPPVEEDEKTSVGPINLLKVNGEWKLQGLTLPPPKK